MRPAHLLLIEDDPDIVQFLTADLQDAGYRVSSASSVMQGLTCARELTPDLVITDLGLPDGDGSDVVRRLRTTSRVPIIVLSARDAVRSKVGLLEAGADDYLVKPFEIQELLARIDAQLRGRTTDRLVVGELELHPSRHLATWAGKELRLSPKEFGLLSLLMQHPGRVYSREEIIGVLWQGELPQRSNVIDVHFSNLKEKLRKEGVYTLLRTVRGIGYALKDSLPVAPPGPPRES